MEQSSSCYEAQIQHQFDRLCHLALKGEAANYHKHMEYRRKHEILFSEMPESDISKLFFADDYDSDYYWFQAMGYDIKVKDTLIAEALQALTEKKRNVILLSYFMEMSDTEIAKKMNVVCSTVHEHRKRSLELLKNILEGNSNEKK